MRQWGRRKLAFVSSWQSPKFKIGQWVEKWTGDYTGPGIVRGISTLANGRLRYLVGHRIEGGYGEFLHVYAEGNLRLRMTDGASAEFDWRLEAERLARVLAESKAREQALEAAATDFVAKVERGEVRSRSSYAAFKAALDEGRQDDDGGASAN
jgi:hypothetical protein